MSRVGYTTRSAWAIHIGNRYVSQDIVCANGDIGLSDNHSIAYCLLGYLCAYYRYYHPLEFITSYLNNAANDDDIKVGTEYAKRNKINVSMPKWGISSGEYNYDTEKNTIAKGLNSIKYMGDKIAGELLNLSKTKHYFRFTELLQDLDELTSIDSRQLEILIRIDFFSEFGNQRELFQITDMFTSLFNKGKAKKINRDKIQNKVFFEDIKPFLNSLTKSGAESKNYTVMDMQKILSIAEDKIKDLGLSDVDEITKIRNFEEALGYLGYTSGKEEDRKKLFIMDIYPLKRKKDGKQFGYSVITKSIGSGKESRFTVFNSVYNKNELHKGDIILLQSYTREGQYFTLTGYKSISAVQQ